MEQLLTQFLEHLRYERNVSEHTSAITTATSTVSRLSRACTPENREENTACFGSRSITSRFVSGFPRYIRRKRRKRRSLVNWRRCGPFSSFLVREGMLELNPAKLVSTPRLEKKLPEHLSIEEAIKFIETPDVETDLGKRDRAMLELMYATGVRVAELTKMNLRISISKQVDSGDRKATEGTHRSFWRAGAEALQNYLDVRDRFLECCAGF